MLPVSKHSALHTRVAVVPEAALSGYSHLEYFHLLLDLSFLARDSLDTIMMDFSVRSFSSHLHLLLTNKLPEFKIQIIKSTAVPCFPPFCLGPLPRRSGLQMPIQ